MTREIEFRAWDHDNNKMIFWTLNDLLIRFGDPEYQFNVEDRPSFLFDWRQYTGLKDKNGKKIFEGDIVSCQLFCPDSNNCWITNSPIVVEWEEYGYDPFIEYGAPDHSFLVEVIGNIYENPELLY